MFLTWFLVVRGIYSKSRRQKSSNLKYLGKFGQCRYPQFFGNKNRLRELRERSIWKSCIETQKSVSEIWKKCGKSEKIRFGDLGWKICSDSSQIWFLRGVMDTFSNDKPRSVIGWPWSDPFQYLHLDIWQRIWPPPTDLGHFCVKGGSRLDREKSVEIWKNFVTSPS